jgi:DNA-binding NtrC family response regulator
MQTYAWPGNVRELQNVVERAVLLGKGSLITMADLPDQIAVGSSAVTRPSAGKTLKEALSGPERQIILEVLRSNNWNRNLTAESLGINRTTLYKKMKRLGLDRPELQSPMDAATASQGY